MSMAPEPPPRSKLLYGVILAAFFVISIGAGAIWVRSSAPKGAAATKASAVTVTLPPSGAPGAPSVSAAPKVITINPVDMNGNESP